MNASTFTYLLAHPQEITPEQVGELQQIIDGVLLDVQAYLANR